MPTFYVTNRTQLPKISSRVNATHVCSLLDPGVRPFLHPKTPKENWLLITCADVLKENVPNAPTREQVQKFLEWGKNLPLDAVVVVHCEAGVSRSTAAAFALMVQHKGRDKIHECAKDLLSVRPQAIPNPLITKYADELLECNGKLHQTAENISNENLKKFLIK